MEFIMNNVLLIVMTLLLFSHPVICQQQKQQKSQLKPEITFREEDIESNKDTRKEEMNRINDRLDSMILALHKFDPGWKYLSMSDSHFMFYNFNSITHPRKNIARIWTRLVARTVELDRIADEETGKMKDE